MKSIVGGIIGGSIVAVIVLGVIILMPNEIEDVTEYVQVEIMENSDVQICHKVIGEMIELSEKHKVASTPELKEKYMEFMLKYAECEKDFPKQLNFLI